MNDIVTLKSMSMLALEHDVDFEVFHGETTHKDKRIRAQMVLSLKDCPAVRVSFGDKKHDQRVSTVALSGNYKIPVKLADLIVAMEQNHTGNHWSRLMDSETPLFNIQNIGAGLITITGVVEEHDEKIDRNMIEGEVRDTYRISVSNTLMNPVTADIINATPMTFHAELALHSDIEADEFIPQAGNEVTLVGEYVFPDRIRVIAVR